MTKLTATQAAALQLIADNAGRVVYFRRNVTGYLRINGNVENALIKAGWAKGSDNEGIRTWELTEAGKALLAPVDAHQATREAGRKAGLTEAQIDSFIARQS